MLSDEFKERKLKTATEIFCYLMTENDKKPKEERETPHELTEKANRYAVWLMIN